MSLLQNSNAISAGGYDINNSLRFRASGNTYLNRTFGSTYTDKTKSTVSFWVKRGSLNINNGHTIMWYNASGASGHITFAGSGAGGTLVNDCLNFSNRNATTGSGDYGFQTTQLFRDPSAWYHIIIVFDTGQATSTNRVKLYVNGTQVTAFVSTQYPSQNYQTTAFLGGNSTAHIIGYGATTGATEYFDGYLAEMHFIDGQALTPSSFGETDTVTGSWVAKKYTGTYGTNGFYLKFSDIATTSGSNAGLGKDFSGNTNYWNTNNISVTAGSNYDAMTDSPTLTSATVANYCVWNPLDSTLASITGGVREANLVVGNGIDLVIRAARATFQIPTSGKWYWEQFWYNTTTTGYIGIGTATTSLSANLGSSSTGYSYNPNGNKFNNGSGTSYGNTFTNGDVIGIAFDADNGKLYFSKNGTWQNSGDPVAGTNAAFTGLTSGPYFPMASVYYGDVWASTFGQRPFSYTPPTGFNRLNAYNLPDSTIKKGNSYMDATLYTGNGGTLSVTNAASFQPDLVWIKSRSNARDNALADSVRGVLKDVASNTTAAETTNTNYLTAFNSDGFTIGDLLKINASGNTFVAWQWKAGSSTVTNTSGTISSQVRANTTTGFSIVTYTGNGTLGATVGHGLGVAPRVILIKSRSILENWAGYFSVLGNGVTINLNASTGAGGSSEWNSTTPTSTVFTIGNGSGNNQNNATYVAYCWSEISGFSRFGSYTGNGSADGPFVYLGFRPKYILFKQSSASGEHWIVFDSTRTTYNIMGVYLHPSLSNAESTFDSNDFLSNGFKIRVNHPALNTNGATYIYMAFAENPFKNSLAR